MRRGFTLIFALLLTSLLLVMGLAFLGQRALEYGSLPRLQQQAAAQALAEAGMEEARVKLEKDLFFPPASGYGQPSFTYSEDVLDPEDNRYQGCYTVTVDLSKRSQPYRIVRLLSVGSAGPRLAPQARYRIYAELDVASQSRTGPPSAANPNLFRYLDWREEDVDPPAHEGPPLPQ